MKVFCFLRAIAAVVMTLVTTKVSAEVIHLKNGTKILGAIVQMSQEDLTVDTADMGQLVIKRRSVASIRGDDGAEITNLHELYSARTENSSQHTFESLLSFAVEDVGCKFEGNTTAGSTLQGISAEPFSVSFPQGFNLSLGGHFLKSNRESSTVQWSKHIYIGVGSAVILPKIFGHENHLALSLHAGATSLKLRHFAWAYPDQNFGNPYAVYTKPMPTISADLRYTTYLSSNLGLNFGVAGMYAQNTKKSEWVTPEEMAPDAMAPLESMRSTLTYAGLSLRF